MRTHAELLANNADYECVAVVIFGLYASNGNLPLRFLKTSGISSDAQRSEDESSG